MKKKALVAAILVATTMSATTAFAATNPFKDLPKDHWAYDAVTMLANDGVLEGYSDGNFNGDKLMNRYEMAEIVSKAMAKYDSAKPADKGAIKKLEKEFASELKDMDVRLTQVESDVAQLKKGQSSFKWWGDARIRHFKNKNSSAVSRLKGGSDISASEYNQWKTKNQNEMRIRLGFYGEPGENLSVTGQLKAENANIARSDYNSSHYAGKVDEKMSFNKLQLDWHAKNGVTVSAGRNELCLGQGLLYWENPVDGVMINKDFAGKANVLIGAGDTSAATWDNSAGYATFANVKARISPAIELSAAYFNQHSDATNSNATWASWDNNNTSYWNKNYTVERNFGQFAYGMNAKLANKWTLIAEGVHNNANVNKTWSDDVSTATGKGGNENRNGFWSRLVYGQQNWSKANTWQVYGEYFALGGLAIDASGWPHRLNIAGGNSYGGEGVRGWGLGASYMLAANTNLELTYYKLKPYDTNSAGFDKYNDTAYAALTYSF